MKFHHCLTEFHGIPSRHDQPTNRYSRTLAEATRLRKKVNGMPVEQMELFYHAEPFDVACNLADKALDFKDHLDDYLEIRAAAPRREKALRGNVNGRRV
jgi:hypothetical protein